MPGTTLLTTKDIHYRLGICEASVVITDEENQWKIDRVLAECPSVKHRIIVGRVGGGWLEYEALVGRARADMPHPDNASGDPMMIYFTSGTTGYPKMVLHTHASYPIGHVITGKYWLDNTPDDLHWTIGHGLGAGGVDLLLRAVEHGRCPLRACSTPAARAGRSTSPRS